MSRLQTSVREAVMIVIAGSVLGLAYTAVLQRGLFGSNVQPLANPAASVPPEFVSLDEVTVLFHSAQALFIDARHEFDFKLGHIEGAINIPLKEYDARLMLLRDVPKGKAIVTYCDGAECNSSIELAKKLSESGFTNVKMFFGGWNEWRAHHFAVESE